MIDIELNFISSGISAEGRKWLQETEAYQLKISEIKKEVLAEYEAAIKQENNWFCRLLLILRRNREVSRRIAKLDSERNLHLNSY